MDIGEEIWNIVIKWDFFQKDTVGKQLVRAADSIASNLSEGFGSYQYKETKNFGYYSRGSLYETKYWLKRTVARKLISNQEIEKIKPLVDELLPKINGFINYLDTMINKKN